MMEGPSFCMLIHIYGNEKLIEKYWGGFDQKKGVVTLVTGP